MLFAVGAGIPRNMLDGTAATGVETVILPPYAALPSPVASHADLLIHPLNGVLYTFGGYYRIAAREIDRICENSGFELRFIEAEAGELYPKDVPLCAKRVGDMFISNPRTAPEICRSAGAAGLHISSRITGLRRLLDSRGGRRRHHSRRGNSRSRAPCRHHGP